MLYKSAINSMINERKYGLKYIIDKDKQVKERLARFFSDYAVRRYYNVDRQVPDSFKEAYAMLHSAENNLRGDHFPFSDAEIDFHQKHKNIVDSLLVQCRNALEGSDNLERSLDTFLTWVITKCGEELRKYQGLSGYVI